MIALVNGFALGGGCELALACDWIVASEKAVFGQPEVNLGICPGFGGTQRLARLVGKAMALEIICTGRQVKADEALRIGLVNHVVPHEKLHEEGLKLARMIAAKGPLAVKMASTSCSAARTSISRTPTRWRPTCSASCARPRTGTKAWRRSWASARRTFKGALTAPLAAVRSRPGRRAQPWPCPGSFGRVVT